MGLRAYFLRIRWGEKSLVSLYISVLSGIILALQYDPATPFYSTGAIELLIPFGAFWRSLHFYASQLFFIFLLVHLFAVLCETGSHVLLYRWIWLIGSIPVAILLLFTGYILRDDATGEAAGAIAENIALSVPLLGGWLNSVLFSITAEGMKRVYANHLVGLGVLWGVLCWDHLRRYRVGFQKQKAVAVGLLVFCLAVPAPMEQARLGVFSIQGPWFFLGLQELLRYVSPFWAGVVFPLSVLMALCLVPMRAPWRRWGLFFTGAWTLVYTVLTLIEVLQG